MKPSKETVDRACEALLKMWGESDTVTNEKLVKTVLEAAMEPSGAHILFEQRLAAISKVGVCQFETDEVAIPGKFGLIRLEE